MPVITRQPFTVAGAVGDVVQMSVVSSNGASSTYTWKQSVDNGTSWTTPDTTYTSGADTNVLSISITSRALDYTNGIKFKCTVDGEDSQPASLIVLGSSYANKLVKGAELFVGLRDVYIGIANLTSSKQDAFSNAETLAATTAVFTTALKNKLDGIEEGATNVIVDAVLSANSTNAIQNSTVKDAVDTLTTADATNLQAAKDYADGVGSTTLSSAQNYADQKIADLVNGADAALDTLKELADALENNPDVISDLTTSIASKADGATFTALANKFSNVTIPNDDPEGEDTVLVNAQYNGNAATATTAEGAKKLVTGAGADVAVGAANQGVYFVNGVPTVMTHTVDSDVPSGAVFTDTFPAQAVGTAQDNDAFYPILATTDGTAADVQATVISNSIKFNPVTGTIQATTFDGNATKDGSGNNIVATYATKANAIASLTVTNNVITYEKANGDSNTLTLPVVGGATSSAAGTNGVVPGATAGQEGYFLRGDGTWVNIPASTIEVMSSNEFTQLLSEAKTNA